MKCQSIIKCEQQNNQIQLKEPKGEFKAFRFDKVLDQGSTQSQAYDHAAFNLVEAVITGYNCKHFITISHDLRVRLDRMR